jgi:TrmH family RNA methyltransferase
MNHPDRPVLHSAANPTVRHLIRMRDNRARRRARRVLVDGWRETAQAIQAGLSLCGIYLPSGSELPPDQFGHHPEHHAIATRKLQWVSAALMERISYGQSARGVVAEFEQPERTLAKLSLPPSPTLLILDQIEKPGNLGAVFRCADAAGVDAIVICGAADPFNPNTIRSSLGAVFRVPFATADESETEQFLISRGIPALAARVESSQSLWEVGLDPPIAIILGSEADGLGDRWARLGDEPIPGVQIPMFGQVDSLNLAVSAAIIAFEAARRRG